MDLRYETPRTLRSRFAEVNWALRNTRPDNIIAKARLQAEHDQISAALEGKSHPGNVGLDEYLERTL